MWSVIGVQAWALVALVAFLGVQHSWYVDASSEVKLGVVLPQHTFLRRSYRSQVTRSLRNAQRALDDVQLGAASVFIGGDTEQEYSEAICSLVDKDRASSLLVIAPQGNPRSSADVAAALAGRLNLPTLIWNPEGYAPIQAGSAPVLYLMPTLQQQLSAMLEFMSLYGWHDYVILSEYPAAIFAGVNASVVEFDDMAITINNLEQEFHHSGDSTKIILVFTSERKFTSLMEVLTESTSKLVDNQHLWLLSSGVMEVVGGGQNYPPGMFAFHFDGSSNSGVKKAIERGFDLWFAGVKEAVSTGGPTVANVLPASCESNLPLASGDDLFRLIADSTPEGFDSTAGSGFAELDVLNLKADGSWKEVGRWSAIDGLDMDGLVWPGGRNSPPAPHSGSQLP